MHGIYGLKKRLCDELEEYGEKEDLDVGTLDVVKSLAVTVDKLEKIIERAEESEYSYDDGGMMRTDGMYSGRSNRGGRTGRYSGARRRDRMGRYSGRRNGYGYSMDNKEMIEDLKELMNDAPDDRTRQEFQSFIEKMERM